jgi:beta-lactamase regulating signal transducer with metallopeptidase domain
MIKFSLCSGALIALYYVLLQGKTLYKFNRYYLLFSLLFSAAIPFITVKTNNPAINIVKPVEENIIVTADDPVQPIAKPLPTSAICKTTAATHQQIDYKQYSIWGLYILVASILLLRFGRNLYIIISTINNSTRLPYKGIKLVLTDEPTTPHTFLTFIFLNQDDYQNKKIDAAIIEHELTHAKELHSTDIILIELLQIICWFNPFIPFYRKAIELNHEFIADAAAVNTQRNTAHYQYLLLNTISQSTGLNLTSHFNYLTIKKRLIMMNKTTPAKHTLWVKVATLPVFIVAFLLFCSKTSLAIPAKKDAAPFTKAKGIANKDTITKKGMPITFIANDYPCTRSGISENELKEYQQIINTYGDRLHKNNQYFTSVITAADKTKLEAIFKKMSRKQQSEQMVGFTYPGLPLAPKQPSQAALDIWKNPRICGVWIDEKKVDNSELDHYKPADFGLAIASRLSKNAINYKKYKYQINLYTVSYYTRLYKKGIENQHTSMMFFRLPRKTEAKKA